MRIFEYLLLASNCCTI